MPANWGTFIPNVTQILSGQSFKNPGSIANSPPRIGSENNPNFATPTYIPFLTPGGRRDWGEALAQEYINAIKTAQTPVGATRFSNPAADQALILAYGEVFERLYRDGDVDLMDTKDENGNIIKEGKESSAAFADLCPDPIEVPDPIEEEKKRRKKFNAFIEKEKSRQIGWRLHRFKFSEFHCIEDGQPQEEVEKLIATKLLREFEAITSDSEKIEFYDWVLRLGSLYYAAETESWYLSSFRSRAIGAYPFFNVDTPTRVDITNAGYSWENLVNNVSKLIVDSIAISYPVYTEQQQTGWTDQYNSLGYYTGRVAVYSDVEIEDMYKRIQKGIDTDIIVPWPYSDPEKKECPLSRYKIQISHTVDDQRPKLLTNNVIALFSYTDQRKVYTGGYNWAPDSNNYLKHIYYDKKTNWIKYNYEDLEYKVKWQGTPPGINENITLDELDTLRSNANAGTVYKFTVQLALDAKKAADECDAKEELPDIPYQYPSGDPYEELAEATITYWYLHLVQPFNKATPMLPALSVPPLMGFYIPIYYGSKTRLAKGLRRALNSGKSFDKLPATQPPAATVATALAATYALHLLEFKLIYLGGIPVPTVPFVPMVGFVPVVF